jgi:protein-L-isoaspartate O-methyltransferase
VGPEGGDQQLKAVDKDAAGNITERVLMGVFYIPLTDTGHQLAR